MLSSGAFLFMTYSSFSSLQDGSCPPLREQTNKSFQRGFVLHGNGSISPPLSFPCTHKNLSAISSVQKGGRLAFYCWLPKQVTQRLAWERGGGLSLWRCIPHPSTSRVCDDKVLVAGARPLAQVFLRKGKGFEKNDAWGNGQRIWSKFALVWPEELFKLPG